MVVHGKPAFAGVSTGGHLQPSELWMVPGAESRTTRRGSLLPDAGRMTNVEFRFEVCSAFEVRERQTHLRPGRPENAVGIMNGAAESPG
jgi:hypothetical protein